jgi:hypothetical protein
MSDFVHPFWASLLFAIRAAVEAAAVTVSAFVLTLLSADLPGKHSTQNKI